MGGGWSRAVEGTASDGRLFFREIFRGLSASVPPDSPPPRRSTTWTGSDVFLDIRNVALGCTEINNDKYSLATVLNSQGWESNLAVMGTYADGWNSWNAQYNQFATNTGPPLVVFSGMWDSKVETFELMEYELAGDVAQALSEMRASNLRHTPLILRTELEEVASAMDVDYRVRISASYFRYPEEQYNDRSIALFIRDGTYYHCS